MNQAAFARLLGTSLLGPRRLVVLVGAGVSKDAGLPTAWDLMMETARQLFVSTEEVEPPDRLKLEEWFLKSPWAGRTYAEIIEAAFPAPGDQTSFLAKHLGNGPGSVHALLAQLARRELVRAFVTTNFDQCLEEALREAGIAAEVIANSDDLSGLLPIIHASAVRVYKPHGTLGRGVLLNTPSDVQSLSLAMEKELVGLFGDHAVLVMGYGGRDPGIMKAIRDRRKSVFSLFWAEPNQLDENVELWISEEGYDMLRGLGASDFLSKYLRSLEQIGQVTETNEVSAWPFVSALTRNQPTTGHLNSYLRGMRNSLVTNLPRQPTDPQDQHLVDYFGSSQRQVIEFATACDQCSLLAADDLVPDLWDGVAQFFGAADRSLVDRPLVKTAEECVSLVGYQMVLCLVGAQIKYGRWANLAKLLGLRFFVNEGPRNRYCSVSDFNYRGGLLETRRKRLKLPVLSGTASLLREAFGAPSLSEVVGLRLAWEADYLIYLRTAITQVGPDLASSWLPHLAAIGDLTTPRYLLQAHARSFFEGDLRPALGMALTSSSAVKRLVGERMFLFQEFWRPAGRTLLFDFEAEELGAQ